MSKFRKIFSVILAVSLVFAIILAGCGSGKEAGTAQTSQAADSTADKATSDAAEPAEEVTINVWGAVPAENGPGAVMEEFNKKFAGKIKAVYTRYVNDESGNTKLDMALLSGEDVDVFTNHGPDRFSKRIVSGMCEKLDDFLTKDGIDVERDFGLSFANYEGSDYALPITNAADFVWINKNMFDAAGIPIPTEWTFEEYKAIAKQLTKGSGDSKVYGTITQTAWPDMWMKPAFIALGPDSASDKYVFNLDNEYFKKSLQLKYDMEVVDQSQVSSIMQKTSKLTMQDMFFKGKVAMMYGGSWLVRYAKDTQNYPTQFISAFAPLPKWDKNMNEYYNSQPTLDEYWAINTKSKNKEAAWEVIKYSGTEGYYPMCGGGKLPSWKNADQNLVVNMFLGEAPEKIFDVESVKRVAFADYNYFTTPLTPARSQVVTMLEQESEKCLAGKQTVDQTLEAMKKAAADIVAKSGQ